jgi:metal-dependent HD superfamily phosphatase/phosphodiesterase
VKEKAIPKPDVADNAAEQLVTLDDVKNHAELRVLIEKADEAVEAIGYTEHGRRHTGLAAKRARAILLGVGASQRRAELGAIAAYLHDLGNLINRNYHAQTAAILVYPALIKLGMPMEEVCDVITAIGNHDEKDGQPVNDLCAAVILADKSDVHRSRVRTTEFLKQDIHDRVNFAATESRLMVNSGSDVIALSLTIDTEISSVMEYFEIFLSRMVVCRRAAEYFNHRFELEINGQRLS